MRDNLYDFPHFSVRFSVLNLNKSFWQSRALRSYDLFDYDRVVRHVIVISYANCLYF